MTVLDVSAVMAYLQDEPGSDMVAAALLKDVRVSEANVAEVLSKAADAGKDPFVDAQNLRRLGMVPEPVAVGDGLLSATFRAREIAVRRPELSLADRLCLALAHRLDMPVLTADRAWTTVDLGVQVTLIR